MSPEFCSEPDRLQAALAGLAEKYSVPVPTGWTLRRGPEDAPGQGILLPGCVICERPVAGEVVPLLPWRSQRRFTELKRLIEEEVVAPVLMTRFSCQTDGVSLGLAGVLYREFDLAEWLLGARIETVAASIQGEAANVIARLANGVVCGIEASAMLPPGTAMLDRHELIARRGVASDRVVDTQVPQQSVYLFTPQGTQAYTDCDAELFEWAADDVALVRAALEAFKDFGRAAPLLRAQHDRLVRLVNLAMESDRLNQRLRL